MEPKTILIIDKDLLSIAAMDQTLERAGLRIFHTTDFHGAQKAIAVNKPDLIICSLRERNVFTRKLLRNSHATGATLHSIPVLFILQPGQHAEAVPDILGPPRFLVLPYSLEQLAAAVMENLRMTSTR